MSFEFRCLDSLPEPVVRSAFEEASSRFVSCCRALSASPLDEGCISEFVSAAFAVSVLRERLEFMEVIK